MKERIKDYIIAHDLPLIASLKQMDRIGSKILIVLKNNKFRGLLSIGDVQRAIIKNIGLDVKIESILRENVRVAHLNDNFDEIKLRMINKRVELMPVVDDNSNLIDVYFWDELMTEIAPEPKFKFNLPVVIMAGGEGVRMRPLTNVLPKPLIPLGEKTIIENIFEKFSKYGCMDYYVSLNYKAELIEYYLQQQNLKQNICFFQEIKPLGTAGSLSLITNKINSTFFVSNCDIIIEQDYSEILEYHRENNNEITIITAFKHFSIPYGIVETGENGELDNLIEKPELTFKINSGMYILEPHLLKEIPKDTFFHITQLIEIIKKRKGKVGVFPVSEKSWIDLGDWSEYIKNIKI